MNPYLFKTDELVEQARLAQHIWERGGEGESPLKQLQSALATATRVTEILVEHDHVWDYYSGACIICGLPSSSHAS